MRRAIKLFGKRVGRRFAAFLPIRLRTVAYSKMLRCDETLSNKFVFKLAETQAELEGCFRLLHEAYLEAGFMQPDPSKMRVTVYHALPTTSTLMCCHGDRVVATLTLIRESALGFPMQRIYDLESIRRTGGNVAEVSALAIDRRFRSASGRILLPLMKFMYEYATRHFDTRHLVIAVNPRHIGFYETLLCFRRLAQQPVTHYDFVNGAPAVGAHLDLRAAPAVFCKRYGHLPPARNLSSYFSDVTVPNIVFPERRFYTTTDPVMTPVLIDYFFNRRTQVFAQLRPRELLLLHAIYDLPEFKYCLPPVPEDTPRSSLRRRTHRRFSVACPGELQLGCPGSSSIYPFKVFECSASGIRVRTKRPIPLDASGEVSIDLGAAYKSVMKVTVLRRGSSDHSITLIRIDQPDAVWAKFVNALGQARTRSELDEATRFM